jgi:hypothetical protein
LIIASLIVLAAVALAACGGGGSSSSESGSGGSTEGGESSDSGGAASTVKVSAITDETGPTASTEEPFALGLKAGFKAYNGELSAGQHEIEVEYYDDKYETGPSVADYK